VEVERQARVAGALVSTAAETRRRTCTHYFSMSTRDARFVVFVRTRPYIERT
jgi:hypothetical protein